MWDVLSGVAKMAWDIMSGMTKHSMGCYGWGEKNTMGCFVPGGKSLWDVLSGVSLNCMGCFVRLPCGPVWSSFPWVESRHTNCSHCLFEHTRKIFGPYLNQ